MGVTIARTLHPQAQVFSISRNDPERRFSPHSLSPYSPCNTNSSLFRPGYSTPARQQHRRCSNGRDRSRTPGCRQGARVGFPAMGKGECPHDCGSRFRVEPASECLDGRQGRGGMHRLKPTLFYVGTGRRGKTACRGRRDGVERGETPDPRPRGAPHTMMMCRLTW